MDRLYHGPRAWPWCGRALARAGGPRHRASMLSSFLYAFLGMALLAIVLWDAFETVLVPRRIGRRIRLSRYFYRGTWRVWRTLARAIHYTPRQEALLGFYGPLSLILLLMVWAAGMIVGF